MITIDGFRPSQADAYVGFSQRSADRFYSWVNHAARRLGVEVTGLRNIPSGRAMLVGNHTFGWDAIFPIAAVFQQLHRPVWTLGEHVWWRFPFVRRAAAAVGTVDGTPENADRLLQHDELVLVLPGGLRESVKPHELRYRLLWGHRYGFIRAAIRNGAPIVPVASIGSDDVFELAGDAFARGQRWLHARIPIPLPAHLPHRAKLRYVFGAPIPMRVPPKSEHDTDVVHAIRHEVEGALYELIDEELVHRAGIELD